MRPQGEAALLFAALSAVARAAFADRRLLSCPVLAKGPDQGDILRRFLVRRRPGPEERPAEGNAAPLSAAAATSVPASATAPVPASAVTPLSALALAGRYAAANGLHFLFLLLGALFVRLLGWSSPLGAPGGRAADNPAARGTLIIDTFAVLPRIAAEGAWRDLYLPGLAEAAVARGLRPLTLYRLYGSRNPLVLWRALKVLARDRRGLLELHLFTPGDWLRLAGHGLLYPISLLRLIRSLKKHPPDSPEAHIREALIRTAGQCVLIGEARRLAGLRLGLTLARLPGKAHIISWYENQTVNKTFQHGLRRAAEAGGKHAPCTGAQLFLWPPSLLNNHADDGEAALGLAPDRVLVNGPHFLPEGSGQNYAIGPSLRYAHLFAVPPTAAAPDAASPAAAPLDAAPSAAACPAAARPDVEKTRSGGPLPGELLVLLSYHPEETRRVLRAALALAAGGQSLCYRFHPATRPKDYAALLPQGARFSGGPPERALAGTLAGGGAVMGAGSGSLAEAVALGLPVLAVEDENPELGLKYLPDFGKGLLWDSVREGEDPLPALERLQRALDAPERKAAVAAFRDVLFTEPTPERVAEMLDWEP